MKVIIVVVAIILLVLDIVTVNITIIFLVVVIVFTCERAWKAERKALTVGSFILLWPTPQLGPASARGGFFFLLLSLKLAGIIFPDSISARYLGHLGRMCPFSPQWWHTVWIVDFDSFIPWYSVHCCQYSSFLLLERGSLIHPGMTNSLPLLTSN